MFGTVLSYISLRLLGLPAEDEACVKGLKFIRDNGGGVMAPSWAKFWMAVLGVYEWDVSYTLWTSRIRWKIWNSLRVQSIPKRNLWC